MLKSFGLAGWVVAGILGAVLFSGVVALGPAPGSVESGKKAEQSKPQERQSSKQPTLHEDQPPAGENKRACREGEKNEECFQRRSVAAAEDQARAADDQAFYTLVGLVLLFFTLVATGAAAVAAFVAARAAGETVQTMRATALLENRAWLKLSPTEAGPVRFKKDDILFSVKVRAENIGKSPATHVSIAGNLHNAEARRLTKGVIEPLLSDMRHAAEENQLRFPDPVLMPGETAEIGFSGPALPLPKGTSGAPDPQRPYLRLSAACAVLYKTVGSDQWHYTAHTLRISRRDGQPFDPELGSVAAQDINVLVLTGGSDIS